MAYQDIAMRLGQVGLFNECSRDELLRIAEVGCATEMDAGSTIAREGELGHEAIVILDGSVTIRRGGRHVTSLATSGAGVRIATLRAGEIVGELSLLADDPRSATVLCESACRLLLIPRDRFTEFLRQNPDVAVKLLGNLARRIQELDGLFDE